MNKEREGGEREGERERARALRDTMERDITVRSLKSKYHA